jgi:hypothetical protein
MSTPRQRRRRRIVIAAVLLLLAYPVLGTLALWTGLVERLLASEDLRVEIENPAWTIWPGRIHMKRVGVYVNGDSQFTLEGRDVVFKMRFLPLLRRRFHVTELRGDDVRYRMRTQVDSVEGIERRVAAFPPLPELPGANVVREPDAEKTEEREAPWTVEVEGVSVRISELWFMEYRYVGGGTLDGSFLVGPERMRVGTSVQDLGPGELRFGPEHALVKHIHGRIVAEVPELNPKLHADQRFLDFVTARLTLKGDVQSLRVLGAYFDGAEVRRGAGPLEIDVLLERGWLGKESFVRYRTDDVRVTRGNFRLKTDWKLDIDVSGTRREHPRIRSSSKNTYLLLNGRSHRAVSVGVHGHSERASLKSRQLGSMLALKSARIQIPSIVTNDLGDLDALLAESSPLRFDRGSASGSLDLAVDDRYVLRGPIRANVDGLLMQAAGVDLGGKASARARLNVDLKKKVTVVRAARLHLRDVMMNVGDEYVDGWWASFSSKRAVAWQLPPKRVETTLAIRAKDAEPLLESLAEKDRLNDLIAKFTSLDDLSATAKLHLGDATDVTLASESDVWDIAGRIYTSDDRKLMALVIGGQAVSIGIASDENGLDIEPFAETEWLNARLRRFPPPQRQLAPEKP